MFTFIIGAAVGYAYTKCPADTFSKKNVMKHVAKFLNK